MPTATLRTVGGSVVMAIPKRLLEMVHLQAGSQVDIDVRNGRLIVAPQPRRRYKLSELIARCDASLPITTGERAWLNAPPAGLEEGGTEP